jgi:hypothetical protein
MAGDIKGLAPPSRVRPSVTRYTMLNQYHAESVSCRPGGRPQVPVRTLSAQRHLCQIIDRAADGANGRPARGSDSIEISLRL